MDDQFVTYYRRFLQTYWFFPSVGHWRGIEATVLSKVVGDSLLPPILDIGCGDGEFFKGWGNNTQQPIIGLDLVPKYARRAAKSGVYKYTLVSDASALPFPSNYFATVFSNSVFEHIGPLECVLSEVHRVLDSGGRLVFTVPTDNLARFLIRTNPLTAIGLTRLAERWAERRNRLLAHKHLYPADKWCLLLEHKGFKVAVLCSYLDAYSVALWELLRDLDWGVGEHRLHVALKYLGYGLDKVGLNIPRRVTVWLMQRLALPRVQRWEAESEQGAGLLIIAVKESPK